MPTSPAPITVPSLYAGLLRAAWNDLDPIVRRVHGAPGPRRARGTFRVSRGKGLLASLMARALGLPRAGDAVPLTLQITPTERGETWHRSFAGMPLVTQQWTDRRGWLLERMGRAVLAFRLASDCGALVFQHKRTWLSLGALLIRVPLALSVEIAARAAADSSENGTMRVAVSFRAPVVGLLLAYEGTLFHQEELP